MDQRENGAQEDAKARANVKTGRLPLPVARVSAVRTYYYCLCTYLPVLPVLAKRVARGPAWNAVPCAVCCAVLCCAVLCGAVLCIS